MLYSKQSTASQNLGIREHCQVIKLTYLGSSVFQSIEFMVLASALKLFKIRLFFRLCGINRPSSCVMHAAPNPGPMSPQHQSMPVQRVHLISFQKRVRHLPPCRATGSIQPSALAADGRLSRGFSPASFPSAGQFAGNSALQLTRIGSLGRQAP